MKIENKIIIFLFFYLISSSFLFSLQIQNPNQYKSFVILDTSELFSSGKLKANVSYLVIQSVEKKIGKHSVMEDKTTLLPATGAYVSFYINNQPITDSNGNPVCLRLMVEKDGIATCNALYFFNPYSTDQKERVLKVLEYDGTMIIQARVESSDKLPQIRPSVSQPTTVLGRKSKSDAFLLSLKALVSNPYNLAVCLPLVMLMGVFIATMFYQARNPLSLLDITVPNLPTIGTAKIKPATIPANLSIMRKEVMFQTRRLETLLKVSKKFLKNEEDRKFIDDLLKRFSKLKSLSIEKEKYEKGIKKIIKGEYEEDIKRIKKMQAPAWLKKNIEDSLNLWQALVVQFESIANARAGEMERRGFIYKTTSNVGKFLSYITKTVPALAYVDKIPYVERIRMTLTNWVAAREANRYMRRQLGGAIAANVMEKIGFEGVFPKYDPNQMVIGYIPNIINEVRLRHTQYSDDIIKNFIIVLSYSIRQQNKDQKSSKIPKEIFGKLLKQAEEDAKKQLDKDKKLLGKNLDNPDEIDNYYRFYVKYNLILGLIKYTRENNIPLILPDGRKLEGNQHKEYLEKIYQIVNRVMRSILDDRDHSIEIARTIGIEKDGITPKLNIKGLDPNRIYKNYQTVSEIIKENIRTFDSGGYPISFLGISIPNFFERVIRNQRKNISDLELLKETRRMVEKEAWKISALEYWLGERKQKLSIRDIREIAGYSIGKEFTLRKFIAPHFINKHSREEEEERYKILRISDYVGFLYGGGKVDVFGQVHADMIKIATKYESLKQTIGFFIPGAKWDAKGFQAWLDRGVLFADTKKAIFIIDAKMELTPVPTGFKLDKNGYPIEAYLEKIFHKNNEYIRYQIKDLGPVLFGSDYAERLVGVKQLFKTSSGKFMIGTPTDLETYKLQNLLTEQSKKFLQEKEIHLEAISKNRGNDLTKSQLLTNLQNISKQLDEKMMILPAGYLFNGGNLDGKISVSLLTKAYYNVAKNIENIGFGMVGGDMSRRLQEWYSSQAYARMVFYNMGENYKKNVYSIPEQEEEQYLKKDVEKYNMTLKKLLDTGKLGLEGPSRFYNVAEQTVMRDPRITYGSGYGLEPAIMSGYPTGQYYPEHPRIYSFYDGIPGSKLTYPLKAISYHLGRAFAIMNRPFFTTMVGYPTVYQMDPELGYPYGHYQRPTLLNSLRSLFKPSASFDFIKLFKDSVELTFGIKTNMHDFSFRKYIQETSQGKSISKFSSFLYFLSFGYYVIENRTGRDITTAGALHRPYELTKPWYIGSVIQRTDVPGMQYYNWNEKRVLDPFAVYNLTRPLKGGSVEKLAAIRSDSTGINYNLDSIRQFYKINTSLIGEFNKIQTTVQSFGLLNSPYVFPLAPVPVLIWQSLKKTKYFRNQPWNALPPIHEQKELTEEEKMRQKNLAIARQEAMGKGERNYSCPFHHIYIPIGGTCPVCYSEEEAMASKQRFSKRIIRKIYIWQNNVKALTKVFGTDHFFNTVHCPYHHVPFEKGLACPMCIQEGLQRQDYSSIKAYSLTNRISKELREVEKQKVRLIKSKKLSDEEKDKQIKILDEQKKALLNSYGVHADIDQSIRYDRKLIEYFIVKRRV